MDFTTLGRTGLSVSVMGLGCGGPSRLGMATGKPVENAVAVVRRALELGFKAEPDFDALWRADDVRRHRTGRV